MRQLLGQVPEQVKQVNEDGNLPLHMAAQIVFTGADESDPVDVIDPNEGRPLAGGCQLLSLEDAAHSEYMYLVNVLLNAFPGAVRARNGDGLLPLHLMIKNGVRHPWTTEKGRYMWSYGTKMYLSEIQQLLVEYPVAICDLDLRGMALSTFLSKLEHDTMYRLLREAPQVILF